jgi:hypothetical protein
VSLDKVESSNPNLKAAHARASTRKTRHLQPSASNAADATAAEGGCGGCFAFSRLASQSLQVGKTRIVHAVLAQRDIPDFPICGQSGPRFPFPAESENGTGLSLDL